MENNIALNGHGKSRWMLVDDNPDFLNLLADFAGDMTDAEIVCFNSPEDALVAFEAAPSAFDLVITDLQMPGMDGVQLGRRLREMSPGLKMLLTTASHQMTAKATAACGFCGFLPKPFSFAGLARALTMAGLGSQCPEKVFGLNVRLRWHALRSF